ncbi:MAG: hypothetical protein JRN59_06315 [Nitrososphaerota archaeon]|nr:hypothetical protein [Nitrososphaerota archaeon]
MMDQLEKQRMLELAESWEHRADQEQDPFTRYVALFVSYNAIYNVIALEDNPDVDLTTGDGKRAIDGVQRITDRLGFVQSLEPLLSNYLGMIPLFKEEYWGRKKEPVSASLKEAYRKRDAEASLRYLMKWLYKVRCNLFHGVKEYGDKQQAELLEKSCMLLRQIVTATRAEL